MWRGTKRVFLALGALLLIAALSGATYQWLATRQELASTPPPIRAGDTVSRSGIPGGRR